MGSDEFWFLLFLGGLVSFFIGAFLPESTTASVMVVLGIKATVIGVGGMFFRGLSNTVNDVRKPPEHHYHDNRHVNVYYRED